MKITLLTSPESIKDMENFAALAALTCHANTDKKPFIPEAVLRGILRLGHESILEHITLTYSVKGLSRACLQELSRHRHISLSVESTRHTLKKKLDGSLFGLGSPLIDKPVPITIVEGKECDLPTLFISYLVKLHKTFPNMADDELKYYLPEFWATNLILTSNVRELRHILKLRTNPAALKEFQELAQELFNAVPDEFKYLLKDCVYGEKK